MARIELSPTTAQPVRWQVHGDRIASSEFATPLDALMHARMLLDGLAHDAACELYVCFDGEHRTRLLHREPGGRDANSERTS